MDFVSRLISQLGPVAGMVLKAIFFSLLGIFLLVAFIVTRRWYRARYFRRLNQRTFALRAVWDDLVAGRLPVKEWRLNPFDCEIVEAILLDNIETANPDQLAPLLSCLRDSGLLDMRIREARVAGSWKRRTALVALGRTRAPEAVPALAEALDSPSEETRVAAVRGLGRTGLPGAAVPLLDRLVGNEIEVPEHTLKNALANCCRKSPSVLISYLNKSTRQTRELIARVLGEVASAELGDGLMIHVVDTRDSYALQAFVSELERSGAIEKVIEALGGSEEHNSAGNVLLDALNAGKKRVEAALISAAAAGRG